MNRVVLSPAASADLEEIWDYTYSRWDQDQAEAYVREIQRAVERVAGNPLIGRACDEARAGYRRHNVGSHSLYFRILADDVIHVVRILHQRMDVDQHLD